VVVGRAAGFAGLRFGYLPAASAKFNGSPKSVVRAGFVSAITRPRRMT
jgi:hypothetical protein